MSILSALWTKFAGWIVAAGAVLTMLGGIYAKGRADQKQNAKLKDMKDANDIRRDGAAARAGADPDRLRSDGWRRD